MRTAASASLSKAPTAAAPATERASTEVPPFASIAAGVTPFEWLLRSSIACCFIGHGAFGLLRKEGWLSYFALFGISSDSAYQFMPIVGTIDIAVGVIALLRPSRALLLYAAGWCLWTAALRPLAGEGIWEMLERAGNYGVPAMLLLWAGRGRWLEPLRVPALTGDSGRVVYRAAIATVVLLLLGHGALAVGGKPLLAQHLDAVGIAASHLELFGATEFALAAMCLLRPSRALLLAIAGWKLATELLYPMSGVPIWEVIERGGSYAAPIAAAMLLPARVGAATRSLRLVSRHGLALAFALALPAMAEAQSRAVPGLSADLIARLREGGQVLVCRHAETEEESDADKIDFDDPSTQRILNETGEAQARSMGAAIRKLGIRAAQVLSSPFQRTRKTAELMFGEVELEDALLWGGGKEARLRDLLTAPLEKGGNRVLMTHQGTLYRTFAEVERGSIGEGIVWWSCRRATRSNWWRTCGRRSGKAPPPARAESSGGPLQTDADLVRWTAVRRASRAAAGRAFAAARPDSVGGFAVIGYHRTGGPDAAGRLRARAIQTLVSH